MAKKKDGAPKQSGFMVRLPEWLRGPMDDLKRKTRRPTTVEVVIALEKHLAAEGLNVRPPK